MREKRTKQNVLRTGMFSANLVSTDMLQLMDYFGSRHARDGKKDGDQKCSIPDFGTGMQGSVLFVFSPVYFLQHRPDIGFGVRIESQIKTDAKILV